MEKEFGDRFQVVETDHWWIVSDASKASIAETARVLEQTHEVFYDEWSALGAKPLNRKLVCVSFADADGLASYREKLGVGAPDGRGFYSTISNRIVVCDEDKEPPGMVRQTSRRKGETRKHSRTAHEAAHQLAFNSGIQRQGRPYPVWFAEGLAGNYEPVEVDDDFGLTAHRQSDRIAVLKNLRAGRDLIPLAEFASLPHDTSTVRNRAQVIYPQAAALFRFLFTEYPDEFETYQAELAKLRLRSAKRSHLERAFASAFGPIEDLEAEWLRYLDRLENKATSTSERTKPRRRGAWY